MQQRGIIQSGEKFKRTLKSLERNADIEGFNFGLNLLISKIREIVLDNPNITLEKLERKIDKSIINFSNRVLETKASLNLGMTYVTLECLKNPDYKKPKALTFEECQCYLLPPLTK